MMQQQTKALAVLLLAAGAFLSCRGGEELPPPPLRPVRYQEVTSSRGMRIRTFSGVARANVESNLSFRVSGNVRRRLVEVGDRVDRAQLIAELDPTDFKLQVQEAEASLAQARAQARRAEADYERVRGLYENRNAARSDLDAARAGAESVRAQIDAAEQRLEQAQSQLSYTRLLAPLSGSIAAVYVEVNENVLAGQQVAMLTSGSRPEVEIAVPETLIGEFRSGSDVDVSFDALGEREFPAMVTKVGVAAMGVATTFPVTVQLLEATPDVRSGMAANVAFTFGSEDSRERFIIPAHAVVEDREGRFVFVVEPTEPGRGRVRRRAVTVGQITGQGLEVLDGISTGDLVVTAGVSQIQDGLEVKLEEESQT